MRVVPLAPQLWALGRATRAARVLRAPVPIGPDGGIGRPLEGVDEALALLHVSSDGDLFPHLIVTPSVVRLVDQRKRPAIAGGALGPAAFMLVEGVGRPRVVLMAPDAEGAPAEVARYDWDPFERSFMGPAADRLAEEEEVFTIDLPRSEAPVPVGGADNGVGSGIASSAEWRESSASAGAAVSCWPVRDQLGELC